MNTRTRPCSLCSSCNAYGYDQEAINTLCNASGNRSSCEGFWQNRTRLADWVSCRSCKGTGYVGPKRCKECGHSGWIPRGR